MATSIKTNFAFSSILTASTYIFPIITFPYITRTLGVYNLGICNFVDSIIQYFILFSMMGIRSVGIREIARVSNNRQKLSHTFMSLICLNLITTIISLLFLFIFIFFVPKFQEHKELFYIGSAKILFNSLLIEWFYKGIENFKYITIRTIIIKTIYVISIFCLIKDSDDYIIYFALTTGMFLVNATINLFYSRNFIDYSLSNISFSPYIKSFLILGCYLFLTSMYTSFNVAYLGFTSGEIEVGYYTTATKLYSVIIALFTAFTGVMLPRMSSLLASGKIKEFKILTSKSLDILLAFSIPLIIFTIFYAPQIVAIIAGIGFEGAVLPMRIIMPLMLFIGYEQILIIQMLMPLKKDRAIFINSLIGAVVGLFLNLLLVGRFGCIGSSIVWICSELAVMISAQCFVSKYLNFHFPFSILFKNLSFSLPSLLLLFIISKLPFNQFILMTIGGLAIFMYFYILQLYILKNITVISLISNIKNRYK